MKQEYFPIGFTGKAKGVKGWLRFRVNANFQDRIGGVKVLFIENAGQVLPFFVEQLQDGPDLMIKLEGVDSKEAAHGITGKETLVLAKDFPELREESGSPGTGGYEQLAGYQLFEKIHGEIGKVEEVVELPQQVMAVVDFRGKELLIPLNESFIVHIDHERQQIQLELPAGLLDL